MEFLTQCVDVFLHLDKHLGLLVQSSGYWVYALLFLIVFCETGLVVFPFLPGDSLLFVAGALAALDEGGMSLVLLIVVLLVAAVLGNMLNYQIGRFLGPKVFQWKNMAWLNREALDKTRDFYERHGGKTLVISRFLPVFRTFAPFVAGVGAMDYARFAFFNLCGAFAWVLSLTCLGYAFGNLEVVKQNLSGVMLGIVLISFMPMVLAYWRQKRV